MDQFETAMDIVTGLQRLATAIENNAASVADVKGEVQHVDSDDVTVFSFQIVAKPPAADTTKSQQPRELTLEERILDAFNTAVHPPPTAQSRPFMAIGVLAAGVAFLAMLTISSPFVAPEQGACSFEGWLATFGFEWETWKHACEWAAMAAQVAIILFIGGIAFTDSFARQVARMTTSWQQATIHRQLSRSAAEREKMQSAYNTLQGILTLQGKYNKTKRALKAFYVLYADAVQLPNRYVWFGVRGLAFNFPGGLYGVFGLFFLFVQVLAISTKIVLDYDHCIP